MLYSDKLIFWIIKLYTVFKDLLIIRTLNINYMVTRLGVIIILCLIALIEIYLVS